tara:strand:+ start:606 stop:1382 length:777 start_codon:yes stop_codon:yes gene_type:complete
MKNILINKTKRNIKNILFLIFFTLIFIIFYNPIIFLKMTLINDLVKSLGFELNVIKVKGNKNISKEIIVNKIKFDECDNLFCIDLEVTREELEKNNWIKSAKLKYGLPSQLVVEIEEEEPLFILRNNENLSLLNASGKKIDNLQVIPNNFKNLIILSGKNAENKVISLLNIFSKNTSVSNKIKEATLISSRRWSLKHSFGITIDLPENNAEKAFFKIVELDEKYGFLNEKIKRVDLRASDRMIVQLKSNINLMKDKNI